MRWLREGESDWGSDETKRNASIESARVEERQQILPVSTLFSPRAPLPPPLVLRRSRKPRAQRTRSRQEGALHPRPRFSE